MPRHAGSLGSQQKVLEKREFQKQRLALETGHVAPGYLGGREDGISTDTVKRRHGTEQRSNGQVKHHRAQCGCEDRGKGGF